MKILYDKKLDQSLLLTKFWKIEWKKWFAKKEVTAVSTYIANASL